jgi:hypothetical protein
MLVARQSSSTSLVVDIFNGVGNNRVLTVTTAAVIVQDLWLTVVVQYRASNKVYSISVNGAVTNTGTLATAIIDRTLTHNWIARSNNNEPYLNADIAGVFVVDEYLGTTATTAIANAMVQGVDLTSAPCEGTCVTCVAGKYNIGSDSAACTDCLAGTYSTSTAATLAATDKIPVAGMALILGVDRFMSEARAITNFIGNAVATLVVAKWDGSFDATKGGDVLVAKRK